MREWVAQSGAEIGTMNGSARSGHSALQLFLHPSSSAYARVEHACCARVGLPALGEWKPHLQSPAASKCFQGSKHHSLNGNLRRDGNGSPTLFLAKAISVFILRYWQCQLNDIWLTEMALGDPHPGRQGCDYRASQSEPQQGSAFGVFIC